MKSSITTILVLTAFVAEAQSHQEKINRELSFEKESAANTILVANINGDISVSGYDGDKVILEVTKSVFGKTNARLEKGKQELQLGVIDRADTLIFYTKDRCHSFGQYSRSKDKNRWHRNGWGYDLTCNDNNCNREGEYDYKMDFVLKVPRSVHVILSTVNEGDVTVENTTGAVHADNVNGSIRLSNISSEANATTVNGDVDIDYVANPRGECRFYTLNGDINAFFQRGLGADLRFESFNGEFFTNIDGIEPLPVSVEKAEDGKNVKYKIKGNRYRVGAGGVALDFETFNGNVYLTEK